MSIEKVVKAVSSMAKDFKERSDVSMFTLFEKSGYKAVSEEVTEQLIENFLRNHPEMIEFWAFHSMDERCDPPWALMSPDDYPNEKNMWSVGHGSEKKIYFKDGFQACAFYIKRFLENMEE